MVDHHEGSIAHTNKKHACPWACMHNIKFYFVCILYNGMRPVVPWWISRPHRPQPCTIILILYTCELYSTGYSCMSNYSMIPWCFHQCAQHHAWSSSDSEYIAYPRVGIASYSRALQILKLANYVIDWSQSSTTHVNGLEVFKLNDRSMHMHAIAIFQLMFMHQLTWSVHHE